MRKSEFDVPETMLEHGVGAIIPVHFIWGIKAPSEYNEHRSLSIRKAVQEQGQQFYLEHPIIAGLIPGENNSVVFIVNGHHRTREAPRHRILAIPVLVFSLALLADFVEKSIPELKHDVETWTSEAIQEFDHKYSRSQKLYRPPQVLPAVTNLDELSSVSKQPNTLGITQFKLLETVSE